MRGPSACRVELPIINSDLHALMSKCVQTIRASLFQKQNWNFKICLEQKRFFPHSAPVKHGTADSMSAIDKRTPFASIV